MFEEKRRFKLVACWLTSLVFFVVGCASSTMIKSRPDGAEVYIDNIKKGVTPLKYEDTAIAGTAKPLRLKKVGYENLDTVIRKSEFEWGPCIGGALVLFPFVWILGYPPEYEFELQPKIQRVGEETQKVTDADSNKTKENTPKQ